MIISFTGHRNDKLGGYILPNPIYNYVCQQTEKILKELSPIKCVSGMSTGYDQWAANICIKLQIPFVATLPILNQEKLWPNQAKRIYYNLLDKAESVIIVSEGGYHPSKMQIRNEFLVNSCDKILACFIPTETSGGTFNCLTYAKKQNKDIIIIDPRVAITQI